MIPDGRSKAEIVDLARRLCIAAAAAERYAGKAKLWAAERDRLESEVVKVAAGSQYDVSQDYVADATVERPKPPSNDTSTPSL